MPNVSTHRIKHLKIMHANVQGLRAKHTEIKHLAARHEPHIIVLNQCKLDFTKVKYNLNGYDKIHESKQKAWGTAMYIRRGIRWAQVDLIPSTMSADRVIEGVAVKVTTDFESGRSVLVRGLYIPSGGLMAGLRPEIQDLLSTGDSINIGDCNLRMVALGHSVSRGAGLEVQPHHRGHLFTRTHEPTVAPVVCRQRHTRPSNHRW